MVREARVMSLEEGTWLPPSSSLSREGLLRNSLLTFIVVDRGWRWWAGRQCACDPPPTTTAVSVCTGDGGAACCVGVEQVRRVAGVAGWVGGSAWKEAGRAAAVSAGAPSRTLLAAIHAHAALTRTALTWLRARRPRRFPIADQRPFQGRQDLPSRGWPPGPKEH